MLKDPKHPMTPGYITDDVSKCINRCIFNYNANINCCWLNVCKVLEIYTVNM